MTPPCIDCREEPGSCPEGRCRSCDIDYLTASSACRECHKSIWREDMFDAKETQHKAGCSLSTSADYGPRNDDETWTIREAVCGSVRPKEEETNQ